MMHEPRKAFTPPRRTSAGFTLVETMVAVSIIMLSIAGPVYTAQRSIIAATTARDQLIASYLAQEGIEYMRMLRDYEYLSEVQASSYPSSPNPTLDGWDQYLNHLLAPCHGSGNGATVCAITSPLQPIGMTTNNPNASVSVTTCGAAAAGPCTPLYLTSNRYTTSNSSGTQTIFTRKIQMYDIGATLTNPNTGGTDPETEQITVTVSWLEHAIPYNTTISDYLSPWE